MEAKFKLDNPGSLQATLSITMTVDGWFRLREKLMQGGDSGPQWPLIYAIQKVLEHAEHHFSVETEHKVDR